MQEKIQNMLNTKFDIEAIPEAKRSDEVDENEISDFGSEEADQVLPLAVEVEGHIGLSSRPGHVRPSRI